MTTPEKTVDAFIEANKVAVFSKIWCPHCFSAKRTLRGTADEVGVMDLNFQWHGGAMQDYLERKTGQRTVPNIFINGKHVGGNSHVQKLVKEGKLNGVLAGEEAEVEGKGDSTPTTHKE